jgi:sporulation protein YlmC with PRC-barrel domain
MRRLFHTAAGVAVAASASAAFAQDAVRPPRNAPPQGQVQVETQIQTQPRVQQREVQKVPEQAPVAQDQHDDGRSVRASQLMGMDLVLEDGNTLGRINDLIIDNQNGQVAFVMVETDQDYRPVPWKAMVLQTGEEQNDHYFVIGMNREKFMQGPAIQRQEWQTYSTAPAQWHTHWQTFQPRVSQFYANVDTRLPANFRRHINATNRDLNQADRKIDQGLRKADRQIDRAERKADRKLD